MTKRRNSRYTKRDENINPYTNLAADIITDAILIASGQSLASNTERIKAQRWLWSEQCQRWAGVIGVDIRSALGHRDSLAGLDQL